MTVAENLLLAREPRGWLGADRPPAAAARAEALLAGFGIDAYRPAGAGRGHLARRAPDRRDRPRDQQPARTSCSSTSRPPRWWSARSRGCSPQIRRLRERGTCIVFTSHRWNEISNIADRITVFRGGRTSARSQTLAEDDAVTLMTGRGVDTLYPPRAAARSPAQPALRGRATCRGPRVQDVSLDAAQGRDPGRRRPRRARPSRAVLHAVRRRAASGGDRALDGRARAHPQPARRGRAGASASPWCPRTARPRACCCAMSVARQPDARDPRGASRASASCAGGWSGSGRDDAGRSGCTCAAAGLGAPVGALSGGNQQKVLSAAGCWRRAASCCSTTSRAASTWRPSTRSTQLMLAPGRARARSILFYSSDAEETGASVPPGAGDARGPDRRRAARARHHAPSTIVSAAVRDARCRLTRQAPRTALPARRRSRLAHRARAECRAVAGDRDAGRER